jgi:hypothetical protein
MSDKDKSTCLWFQEEEDGACWQGTCDNNRSFVFNYGGPQDNGFRFCPYCGMPIEESFYSEDEEE